MFNKKINLFIFIIFVSSANVIAKNGPEIYIQGQKQFEERINNKLKKTCLNGDSLSCAVLKYRRRPTRRNIKSVTKILKNYPCRVSKINNCTHHLFARIYMDKHKSALKLARKMCQHQHEYSCRQLATFKALGSFQ